MQIKRNKGSHPMSVIPDALENTTFPTNIRRNNYEKIYQIHLQFTYVAMQPWRGELNDMYWRVNSLIMETASEICLTQMSTKKGIVKHEYKAIEAILTEFTQLYNKVTVEPIDLDILTAEERKKALGAIILVTEK